MDKLRQKREKECIEQYMKKLTVVNKAKRTALIIGGAALLGGACGTGGYFAYKAMTTKPGIVEAESFIVEFNTNEGSKINAVKVKKGEKLEKVETPTKESCVFKGWYYDEQLKNPVTFPCEVTKNLTLYAKWDNAITVDGIGYLLNADGQSYSVYCSDEEEFAKNNPNGVLTIPNEYNRKPVTSIGYYNEETGISVGFENCTKIKTLDLSKSKELVTINNNAFKNCISLKDIPTLSAVQYIGDSAFENCFTLTYINSTTEGLFNLSAYNNLFSIGEHAFANNYLLRTIVLPQNILKLGNGAFYHCYCVQQAVFAGCQYLKTIPESCFESCSNLTSVNFTVPILKVEKNAFKDCLALTDVRIEDIYSSWSNNDGQQVTEFAKTLSDGTAIHKDAFIDDTTKLSFYYSGYNCCSVADSSLRPETQTSITIPNTITINTQENEEVTLTVNRIAEYGFYRSNIQQLTLPETIQSIDNNAFMMCMDLTEVDFLNIQNSRLINIGENAFRSCAFTSITLPDSLTTIGDNAFCFTSIESINIPSNVTSIAYSTIEVEDPSSGTKYNTKVAPFYGCHKLKSITVSDNNVGNYFSENNSLYITNGADDYTLLRCPEALEVTDNTFITKENTTIIAAGAFYDVSIINKVVINSACSVIEERAFNSDGTSTNNIKEVVFEDNSQLYSIGEFAFAKTSITAINLPSSLERIYDYAFYSCSGLKNVTIPQSVEYIGNAIFRGSGLGSSSTITFEDKTHLWTIYNVKTGGKSKDFNPIEDGKTSYAAFEYLKGIKSGTYYWVKQELQ